MSTPTPLDGWLLDVVAEVDKSAPGFAGHVLRASNERRHVIAAYFAQIKNVDAQDATIGQYLMTARHSDILQSGFGEVHTGFRSALRRVTPTAHSQSFYLNLFRLFRGPAYGADRRAIVDMQNIDLTKLRILKSLPKDFRCSNLVMALQSEDEAKAFVELIGLFEVEGLDRCEMALAASRIRTKTGVAKFAERWSRKLALPPHPVPETDFYQPVSHARDLARIAIRRRNCLRSKIVESLEGRLAIAEVKVLGEDAVVALVKRRDAWMLDDVYGHRNAAPSRPLVALVIQHLELHGIPVRPPASRDEAKWRSLSLLLEK